MSEFRRIARFYFILFVFACYIAVRLTTIHLEDQRMPNPPPATTAVPSP